MNPRCWLAKHGTFERGLMPPCSGQLRRVHLIPQQVLRKELPVYLRQSLMWDEAVWVWGCGGPDYGNDGHHGMLDQAKTLHIARAEIPNATELFAHRFDLTWYLDRTYK